MDPRTDKRIRADLAKLDRSGHRRVRDRVRFFGTGRFVQKAQGESGPVRVSHVVGGDRHEGPRAGCPACPPS